MKWSIERLVQQYDAATVFVGAATIVVIAELLLMRIFVPAVPYLESKELTAMLDQVCADTNVLAISRKLDTWELDSSRLVARLSGNASQWQQELVAYHAFGERQIQQEVRSGTTDVRAEQVLKADFAEKQLQLQSVMTGRTALANINGRIYTVGDKISIMGGEIVMTVVEIGTDYTVIQLVDAIAVEETTRTINLSRIYRVMTGVQNP